MPAAWSGHGTIHRGPPTGQRLRTPATALLAPGMVGRRGALGRGAVAGALGVAVSQRRFTLAYQPVVSLATGLAHHHEVLVRFEDGGSPFALIRMAEEFDLIEELDHSIVEQVVKKLANDHERKLKLAVNISGQTIGNESFIDHVSRLLSRYDGAKGRLIFEITETRAIDNLTLANQHIQSLRALGSLVCLDDFGAGSSSFAYLQQLSLDIVKIDGRYVRELADNGRDGALVRRLVELCRDLKVRTVAEMVETAEVEEIVRNVGVGAGEVLADLVGRPGQTARHRALLRVARQGPRERGLGDTRDGDAQVEGGLHRPRAGALRSGLVEDDIHQRLARLGIRLAQHLGGDLDEVRLQFAAVPLGEHVGDLGGGAVEPA